MNYLWKPSSKLVENSILNQFTKNIDVKFEKNFKKLWLWSIENPENFGQNFGTFQRLLGIKETKLLLKIKYLINQNFFLIAD